MVWVCIALILTKKKVLAYDSACTCKLIAILPSNRLQILWFEPRRAQRTEGDMVPGVGPRSKGNCFVSDYLTDIHVEQ